MYVLSQDKKGKTDISSYFSEDFFNSSIIYQFSRVPLDEYTMTYRNREDLVSRDFYGNPQYFGLVLLSVGSILDKGPDGQIVINEGFEPLDKINLKDLSELRSAQLLTVIDNALTTKEINPLRSPLHEHFEFQSKRFKPVVGN